MHFIDLGTQQARIRAKIDMRIKTVLDHGGYIMGPEVTELEQALCSFSEAKHCVTCASGTDALLMILMAWDVGPGDAVFVPSFTFFATGEMVSLLGATPVMVDICPTSYNIDPAALRKAIAALEAQDPDIYPLPTTAVKHKLRARAIIPVDLFGQAADYGSILPLAREHGLLVLEDAAQAFGASYKGRKTCSLACDAAATSFFPAKPLGCYGDGGAVFTDDDALADRLRSIRVHGKGSDKYDNVRIGLNGRMDTLQAAILLPKLDIFPEEIESRQQVAGWYERELTRQPLLTLPHVDADRTSTWAQYCVRVADGRRDSLAAALKAEGVPTNIYYPTPMHCLNAYRDMGYRPEDMPVALQSSREILALPFHPYMRENDVRKVAAAMNKELSA